MFPSNWLVAAFWCVGGLYSCGWHLGVPVHPSLPLSPRTSLAAPSQACRRLACHAKLRLRLGLGLGSRLRLGLGLGSRRRFGLGLGSRLRLGLGLGNRLRLGLGFGNRPPATWPRPWPSPSPPATPRRCSRAAREGSAQFRRFLTFICLIPLVCFLLKLIGSGQ